MLDIFKLTHEQVERAFFARFCHPPQLIQKRELVVDGIATGQFLYFYQVEEVTPVSDPPAKVEARPLSFEVCLELPKGRADCSCWFFMQTGSVCPHIACMLRYEEHYLDLGSRRFFKSDALLSHVLSGIEPTYAGYVERKFNLLRECYQNSPAWRRHWIGPAAADRKDEAA
jgi:hypothetical protein